MGNHDVLIEVNKFNPYHDARGRFTTAGNASSFTIRTRAKYQQNMADNAIRREKRLFQQVHRPSAPKIIRDARGFANFDQADFHKLHSGAKYFKQQNFDAQEKQAVKNYLEARTEPGSLYSHSQNLNMMMVKGQPLKGKYKQTHDGLMKAMHNIGYNVELTRYDHGDVVNNLLKKLGAGTNYEKMTPTQLKKALVGQDLGENKFISATYDDFAKVSPSQAQAFTSRAVKINYKVKADTQAIMPGNGPGGNFSEIVLAPTDGKHNKMGKILDVRFTGKQARRKGTQIYNQPQIEIDILIG